MFFFKRRPKKLSEQDAQGMRRAGHLVGETLSYIANFVTPGTTTDRVNQLVHDYTLKNHATPAPLNYRGFPKSVCTSVNDCMCHGVPSSYQLKEGDIVNIDVTSILEGYHADASFTFPVGDISPEAVDLCKTAISARNAGIAAAGPKVATGTIGYAIESFVKKTPFFVNRHIGGHGIGLVFHGDPFIPSVGQIGHGPKLTPWSCITVEPIINADDSEMVTFEIPGSTVRYYHTETKGLSAQTEHTILITDKGIEILTLWDEPTF